MGGHDEGGVGCGCRNWSDERYASDGCGPVESVSTDHLLIPAPVHVVGHDLTEVTEANDATAAWGSLGSCVSCHLNHLRFPFLLTPAHKGTRRVRGLDRLCR